MKPKILTVMQLTAILQDMSARVAAGDSLEE